MNVTTQNDRLPQEITFDDLCQAEKELIPVIDGFLVCAAVDCDQTFIGEYPQIYCCAACQQRVNQRNYRSRKKEPSNPL